MTRLFYASVFLFFNFSFLFAQGPYVRNYGDMPLRFEPNAGQSDSRALFITRAEGYTAFLTSDGFVFKGTSSQSSNSVLRMSFVGANRTSNPTGIDRLTSYSNYFIGSDPTKWRSKVPNYSQVRYRKLYPGIDLVYYGNGKQLEQDFRVSPKGNPAAIRIALDSAAQLAMGSDGNLEVPTASGRFLLHRPLAYQLDSSRRRHWVTVSYNMVGKNGIGFVLGDYDHRRTLVIDPVLSYSTYLGGSADDWGTGIAVDSTGHAYVTGGTNSIDFPVASPYQPTNHGPTNVFITKFSSDGKSVLFSTYLGGSGSICGNGDRANTITVSPTGYAYLAGVAFSSDFPVTANAYQKSGGGCSLGGGGGSAFISVFSPNGSSLVYSTYFGGGFVDPISIASIALDASGNIYFAGFDQNGGITTPGAFQTQLDQNNDPSAFAGKFNANGSKLLYCTYFHGTDPNEFEQTYATALVVDNLGNAFITGLVDTVSLPITPFAYQTTLGGGADAMLAGINPNGSGVVYSSYLGGTGYETGSGIAIDRAGNITVTGLTISQDFPTTPGAFQMAYPGGKNGSAFVTRFLRNSTHTVYSTYLGGSNGSSGSAVAVGPDCQSQCPVLAYGSTSSSDFPLLNPLQTSGDLYVSVLNPNLSQLLGYSTLFGSSRGDLPMGVAVDRALNVYITGNTTSTNFPVTPGAFQTTNHGGGLYGDAFISKIAPK